MELKFILGIAETAIAQGHETNTKTQFICFENIEDTKFKVGENILNKDFHGGNKVFIIIKNLEGLSVLERMVKEVKKNLKKEKQLLNN